MSDLTGGVAEYPSYMSHVCNNPACMQYKGQTDTDITLQDVKKLYILRRIIDGFETSFLVRIYEQLPDLFYDIHNNNDPLQKKIIVLMDTILLALHKKQTLEFDIRKYYSRKDFGALSLLELLTVFKVFPEICNLPTATMEDKMCSVKTLTLILQQLEHKGYTDISPYVVFPRDVYKNNMLQRYNKCKILTWQFAENSPNYRMLELFCFCSQLTN